MLTNKEFHEHMGLHNLISGIWNWSRSSSPNQLECLKSIDTFLSKFKSEHEEISKKLYWCKLNEDIPHPPLISPMIEKFTQWKSFIKEKREK
jgi:hypothetical protein